MNCKINIEMNNSAFEIPEIEMERILDELKMVLPRAINSNVKKFEHFILDLNGNEVGSMILSK